MKTKKRGAQPPKPKQRAHTRPVRRRRRTRKRGRTRRIGANQETGNTNTCSGTRDGIGRGGGGEPGGGREAYHLERQGGSTGREARRRSGSPAAGEGRRCGPTKEAEASRRTSRGGRRAQLLVFIRCWASRIRRGGNWAGLSRFQAHSSYPVSE